MLKRCEHRMLEQCPSILAWSEAEQCPTNAPHALTQIFGLLEHPSHVSNVRRGAARFASLRDEKPLTANASRDLSGQVLVGKELTP